MKMVVAVSAAVLAGTAGMAVSAPVIDGQLGSDSYGAIRWVQNQPTRYGNNLSGTSGTIGTPQNVRTGVEIAIPLASIGNPAPGAIKLGGFINSGSHDFASNQVIGGAASNAGNFGDPRNLNFGTNANAPGEQFITLNPAVVGGTPGSPETAPVMDGSAAGADETRYGAAQFVQNVFTGFGNNTQTNGVTCGGSEIDAVYAVIWNNNTPADATDDVLYITVAGNLETNFNKLDLFFDTQAGGQNRLLAGNAAIDFEGLIRMGDGGTGNGLTFDSGFEPDFYLGVTNGSPTTGFFQIFANFANLATVPDGIGYFVGSGTQVATPAPNDVAVNNPGGTITPGDVGAPTLLVSIDNSNIAGVPGSPTNVSRPNRDIAAGSEINGLYATIDGGYLYVLVTGNLENNGNTLELFFDVDSGSASPEGQNRLRFDNISADFGGLLRMCATDNTLVDGMKFETGFTADYWLSTKNFGFPIENFAYASVLRLNGPDLDGSFFQLDYGAYDGGVKSSNDPINFDGPRRDVQDQSSTNGLFTNYGPRLTRLIADNPVGVATPNLIELAIDNNNILGVTGADASPSVAGAAAVTTGVEFRIRLDELGWDNSSPIRIAGFIANGGRDNVSNQVLGGLDGFVEGDANSVAANLDEPRAVDFSTIAGTQYVEISTTPSCPADLDNGSATGTPDGGVDINDLLYFLTQFEAGNMDLDNDGVDPQVPDGGTDINDLLFFLFHFEAGC
jgi:hypothetical protein